MLMRQLLALPEQQQLVQGDVQLAARGNKRAMGGMRSMGMGALEWPQPLRLKKCCRQLGARRQQPAGTHLAAACLMSATVCSYLILHHITTDLF
jgi:hypothetical protein